MWRAFLLVIFIGLILLVLRGMRGPVHTLNTIQGPIRDLLRRGYNGGFLIISISHSRSFLQLRKYIKGRGDYGIAMIFPRAKWSVPFFSELEKLCTVEAIPFIYEKGGRDGPLDFLVVDFGVDYEQAEDFVRKTLSRVFGVDESVKLFVRMENATVEDKLIDAL